MPYRAPIDDIAFALDTASGLSDLLARTTYEGVDRDLAISVLGEAAKFAEEELVPLDKVGDRNPTKLVDGKVIVAPGWGDAYRRWREAGWNALPGPIDFGGQGLPHTISMAVNEIWTSANLSFGLCPLLTHGAIDALHMVASEELKRAYLPKMVSGEWTGTMNLTEPHAGTDLGAVKTKAVPQGDGSYRIFGTKIFITYGDHEISDNIIHLVLARLPDAPAGTKGISLFLVPKFLPTPEGMPGARNDLRCTGVEHKLGIHGSPTCVMTYGEHDGAIGYLVGEANRGLNHMFIMMNRARLGVGVQGVAVAERATQGAIAYANQRRQGRTEQTPTGQMAPIVQHPDVRRNLLTMRALTAASRAICLATARELDIAERGKDSAERAAAANRVALLTPIAKAFSTDTAVEVASIGIQVHGGMGFIEETGAAQHYRDARILPIYEGTNGVQAIDLVTRKLPLEGGKVLGEYLGWLDRSTEEIAASNAPRLDGVGQRLRAANAALREASQWLGDALRREPNEALAGATPYLRLFGVATGGVLLGKGALLSHRSASPLAAGQASLSRYFAETQSASADGLRQTITEGARAVLAAELSLLP
jgi:acyl-CoA dehydrogenase